MIVECEIKNYEKMINYLENKSNQLSNYYNNVIEFCKENKERVIIDETITSELNSLIEDIATIKNLEKDNWEIAKPKKFKITHLHYFTIEKGVIVIDKYMIENNIIGDITILSLLIHNKISHILESDTFKISLNSISFEIKVKHHLLIDVKAYTNKQLGRHI